MTSLIEKTVAVIAPYRCIMCGDYDNIVCASCIKTLPHFTHPICLLCGAPTADWRPCDMCKPTAALSYLSACAPYDEKLGALIKEYKFNFARAAAKPLALLLDSHLPVFDNWHVVHIPTAAPRIRWRGYDHARLLARTFARVRRQPFLEDALHRNHNKRQVGASRKERQLQADTLFTVRRADKIQAKNILVVDDVCTTGATFSAAAAALTDAGAARVAAAAVAWQPKN